MITIIDSGGANIASIQFSLERLGATAQLSRDVDVIKKSSHLILPGVGSAANAMQCLRDAALISTLRTLQQPVLGICLGMQLMFDFSEEGNVPCLGVIPGKIQKMQTQLTIPHMGWNQVSITQKNLLVTNIADQLSVYFVHSYAAPIGTFTTGITTYGQAFSALVQFNNYYGAQFHPERSGPIGAQLIKNFLEL